MADVTDELVRNAKKIKELASKINFKRKFYYKEADWIEAGERTRKSADDIVVLAQAIKQKSYELGPGK